MCEKKSETFSLSSPLELHCGRYVGSKNINFSESFIIVGRGTRACFVRFSSDDLSYMRPLQAIIIATAFCMVISRDGIFLRL